MNDGSIEVKETVEKVLALPSYEDLFVGDYDCNYRSDISIDDLKSLAINYKQIREALCERCECKIDHVQPCHCCRD